MVARLELLVKGLTKSEYTELYAYVYNALTMLGKRGNLDGIMNDFPGRLNQEFRSDYSVTFHDAEDGTIANPRDVDVFIVRVASPTTTVH